MKTILDKIYCKFAVSCLNPSKEYRFFNLEESSAVSTLKISVIFDTWSIISDCSFSG
jgi:hypothetical protein